LFKHAIFSYLKAFITTAALIFISAGNLFYQQAWVFLALFFVPMALIAAYLFKLSPELLKRRLDTKEKKPGQGALAKLFYIIIGSFFVLSGLDRRFGWSSVPFAVVVASQAFFLAGYLLLFLSLKENKYLAHTVVVTKDQQVVTTGPYAFVRHPFYLAELIMFIFAPLALGSCWGVISNILLIAILAIRIVTEEQFLLQELKGYREYTSKTIYRLVPGIW
jgi:protein-S-isoprenylcysteine O-methyltransferase Ste14